MTNKAQNYLVQLNPVPTLPVKAFLTHKPRPIELPPMLLDEYRQGEANEYSHPAEQLRQVYRKALGFPFDWGHILLRRTPHHVIWDYCMTDLLQLYLSKGLRLIDLQRVVFFTLESGLTQTSTDIHAAMSLTTGWLFLPGQGFSTLTQVIALRDEKVARNWTVTRLLHRHMDALIEAAEVYADQD